MCVHVAHGGFIHRCTHQSWTQKRYTHMQSGEKWLKGNYLVLMGDTEVRNKACLLCLLVELMSCGEREEVAAACCQWWGNRFHWNQSSAGTKSAWAHWRIPAAPWTSLLSAGHCINPPSVLLQWFFFLNSIRFHCEFVALACLASCCFPFR